MAVTPGVSDGYQDDTGLAARSDVLAFTSDPLPTALEVVGNPVAEFSHRSDHPSADLFVRLVGTWMDAIVRVIRRAKVAA